MKLYVGTYVRVKKRFGHIVVVTNLMLASSQEEVLGRLIKIATENHPREAGYEFLDDGVTAAEVSDDLYYDDERYPEQQESKHECQDK